MVVGGAFEGIVIGIIIKVGKIEGEEMIRVVRDNKIEAKAKKKGGGGKMGVENKVWEESGKGGT